MYRKSLRASKRENKRRRCAAMRAAKERKRLEQAEAAECVGTITFDGPLFGGGHEIRCLHSDSYSENHLILEIDGKPFKPKTVSGLHRLLARRLHKH